LRWIATSFEKKNQSNEIKTPYVKSEDQLANILTKGLDPKPFEENINNLEMINIFSQDKNCNEDKEAFKEDKYFLIPNLRGSVEK
jgi:hypothetical protein